MFLLSKKTLWKKNVFEGSISNVDLGLFYPNNQLVFSFATFSFYLNHSNNVTRN